MNILSDIIIIFTAFAGFMLAFYIRHKKASQEVLVCPLDGKCEEVVHSEYSKFFGIPLEVIGMIYYALVGISYAIFVVSPIFYSSLAIFLIFGATITAFLFSLYLTFIQAFVLKKWCTWCLVSAGFCTVIFVSALIGSSVNFIDLLADYRFLILLLHTFGFVLGVGGATITDVFFFKFLKDFKISEWEAEIMHTLSQIIWFALAILIISGIGLYLPAAERLIASPKFLVKLVVVGAIIINGIFLNLIVSPQLIRISFGEKHNHKVGELHHIRKLAFALGAVSLTSWYIALILGMLRSIPLSFIAALGVYAGVLLIAIIGSQILERLFNKRAQL